MNSIDTLAIAKAIKAAAAKTARRDITSGEYNVDLNINVRGTMKVGEDYEQVQHMNVPQWELIAALADKLNGVTLESVVAEVLADDIDTANVKARVQAAVDTVKGTANQTTKGKVTTKLTVTEIAA